MDNNNSHAQAHARTRNERLAGLIQTNKVEKRTYVCKRCGLELHCSGRANLQFQKDFVYCRDERGNTQNHKWEIPQMGDEE